MLKVGVPAPEFTGAMTDGDTFCLGAACRSGPVVLYFFPKAFTRG